MRILCALAVLALATTATPLVAQDSTAALAPTAISAPAAAVDSTSRAPIAASVAVGVQLHAAAAPAPEPKTPGPLSALSATSTMIFGGAVLGVGVIVGGDAGRILVVSGAIIGLYGLYQFLK